MRAESTRWCRDIRFADDGGGETDVWISYGGKSLQVFLYRREIFLTWMIDDVEMSQKESQVFGW